MDKKDAKESQDGSLRGTGISQVDVNKTLDAGCDLKEEAERKKSLLDYYPYIPSPVPDGASTPQASQQPPGELLCSPNLLFFDSPQEGCVHSTMVMTRATPTWHHERLLPGVGKDSPVHPPHRLSAHGLAKHSHTELQHNYYH